MLTILDRYILGRFVSYLVFALLAAMLIFVTVDATEQLDKFIDAQAGYLVFIRYYVLYLPFITYLTLPVSVLLATLFTVGGFVYRSELTAMQSAGYSLWRVLFLLVAASLPLSLGALALGETIVPNFNHQRKDIYRNELKKTQGGAANRQGRLYMQVGAGSYLRIDTYDPISQSGRKVSIHTVENGRIVGRVDAEQIRFVERGWMLHKVTVRNYSLPSFVPQKSDSMLREDLGITPTDLARVNIEPEEMNYWDLKSMVVRLEAAGIRASKWTVDLAVKLAQPFASTIIVLFGVPFAAYRRRGGLVMGFGLSLLVCFLYFGLIQVGKILGYNGTITPFVAAWSGNVLFGLFGIFLVVRVPK